MFLLDYHKAIMKKYLIYLAIVLSAFIFGFVGGISYHKSKEPTKIIKEIKAVEKKNDSLQEIADKAEKETVVYKDRVITKYQTVTKEVIKYVEKENSNPDHIIWLDADWVRVHDSSVDAGNGETPSATGSFDATSGTSEKVGVKSGEALRIISENYQSYAQCKVQLEGLQEYVKDITDRMNK